MFNKNLSKFVSNDISRAYLNYVFYNKATGEYVATDGHIMGIEKTPDTYDTNKFLSPLTGLPADTGLVFPDYQRIIPASGDIVTERVFKSYTRVERSKFNANKIVQIGNVFVDFKLLKTVLDFIGSDFVLSMNEPITPLKFVSFDGLRTAVLMPLRIDNITDFTASEDIDTVKSIRTQSKAAKYVYIAFDADGAVRGVFNKKPDAHREATGEVKEFPLI